MSLNGLDNPKLAEAYETVSAEPGGWFLIKYATRDEVELMARGNGGITEVRNAVAEYDETSPLYGFLKYRRRNVIIKYLPDGCSRLIQARVAVHFNAVCERFSPYDITFDITEPDELKDTRLSAACSLHAASNSNTSSTSSLRKKRLGEIAEEDEDEQRATKRQSLTPDGDDDGPQSIAEPTEPAEPVTLNKDLAASPEQSKFSAATTSELPNFVGAGSQRPSTSSAATVAHVDTSSSRRLSSQTLRPDIFSYSSYAYSKPKVKLGPRPSLDVSARPQTAGNFRPVSTIPAGLKLFGKGGSKKGKPRDDASSLASPQEEIAEISFAAATAPGASPDAEPIRPNTSSGVSTVSTIMSAPMPVPAKGTISREKARLMKAKQLREKKKKMSMMPSEPPTPTTPGLPDIARTDEATPPTESEEAPEKITEEAEPKDEETSQPQAENEAAKRLSMLKADSGVVLETLSSAVYTDQASELTHTDSRPASPVVASSEPDHSTKASSLSESTDETVQAKEDEAFEEKRDVPEDKPEPAPFSDEGESDETARPSSEHKTVVETKAEEPTLDESVVDSQPVEKAAAAPAEEAVQVEHTTVEERILESQPATAVVESESPEVEKEAPAVAVITLEDAALEAPKATEEKPAEIIGAKPEQVEDVQEENQTEVEPKMDEVVAEPQISPEVTETSAPEEAPDAATETTASASQENSTQAVDEESQDTAAQRSNKLADIPTSESAEEAQPSNVRPETPENAPAQTTTTENEEPSSPRLKIPKSKFSTQDLRAAAKAAAAIPSVPVPSAPTALAENPLPEPAAAADSTVPESEHGDDDETSAQGPQQPKRKTFVEPIRTDLSLHSRHTSHSDGFSVDEDFMDELQSATVEEAKPMFVVKTPITPGFPVDALMVGGQQPATPVSAKPHMVRTVSNPLRGPLIPPTDVSQSSARSVSMGAAYLHKVTQQQAAGADLSKKGNVGSGISQRIKALEMLSADGGPARTASTKSSSRDRPSSTFFSVKKGREQSRSPSVVDRASSFTKQTPSPAMESRESSPEVTSRPRRDRSGSIGSRLSIFESPPGASGTSKGNNPRGRPESISVTAKIIRDPNQGMDSPRNPSEYNHLALKQSPLLVDHQKATGDSHERRSSRESRRSGSHDRGKDGKSRRSSFSIVKDFINERRKSITSSSGDNLATPLSGAASSRSPSRPPSKHHNTTFSHRLSMSSRRSLSRDRENVLSPSAMTESSLSGDESKSTSDKKKSRAGRFMRRLSSLSSSRSKGVALPGISPTVTEEDLAPEPTLARPSTMGTPAIVSYLGDVNVQFPDNLLWKRRNMCLDASGFLMLSALPAQSGRPAAAQQGTKRYHLSEFRQPYTPDVEVQELPNSVVLDLIEGSGVQVACEDRAGQMAILQVLQEAHSAHAERFGL